MELLPLVCFCLLTCSGTTFGAEEPPATKITVKEDEDVILPCSFGSKNIEYETFDWKKDDKKKVFMYNAGTHSNNGRAGQDPQFKGRVFHFEDQLHSGNASIEIRNITKTDSGNYTCIFPLVWSGRTRSMIELIVDYILIKDRTKENKPGSSPKPHVSILHQTRDWALLECKVQGAFPQPKVQWFDSDNNTVPAEEPQVTESGGKFNIILNANVTKTGHYRCVSTQNHTKICHQVDQNIHVYLHGAAPKPHVKIVKETNKGVLLQCEVRGASPKPKVVWKDRAGNILPAKEPEVTENKGRYNINLKTTVTKTDNYRCVSTQEEISREVYTETHVIVPGPNTGWIGVIVVVIVIAAVGFAIVLYIRRKYKERRGEI